MEAHSKPPSRFQRLQRWWKRVFFWQSIPAASQEAVPHAHADQALVAAVTEAQKLPRWQQLRYLSHIFSRKERLQFWSALAAGIVFACIGGGFLAEPHLSRQPARGGVLTEGIVGGPKWINPVLAPLSDVDRDLSQLVFSGLFAFDGLDLKPDLATSVQLLDQNRVLEIRLREDARFHDGQPLTADDVVFTVNDAIKNPAWHSPLAGAFKQIEAVRIDERTVQIKNAEPIGNLRAFEERLAVGILPAHRWAEANDGSPQLAEANLKPIGSGPYQFDSFTRDARGSILTYTLKRFPGYYGQAPYLDQRQFRFYPDRKSAEGALQSNQIDALAFIPWSEQAQMRVTGERTVKIELPQVTTVFFNTQDALIKDKGIRAALQLAIDRGELSQQVAHSRPVQTPFPFFETYATSSQLANLDEARRLLEERRWRLDEPSGQRFLQPAPTAARSTRTVAATTTVPLTLATSTPLTLTLLVPAQGDLPLVADYLKRRWSLLGADVTIEPLERDAIVRRALDEHTHQIVLLNILAASDGELAPFWEGGQDSLAFSQWTSPTITAGFQALANATSSEVVTQARVRITDAILNERAASFLLRPSYAYSFQNSVQGASDLQILHPADRLSAAQDWYVQTKIRWQSQP